MSKYIDRYIWVSILYQNLACPTKAFPVVETSFRVQSRLHSSIAMDGASVPSALDEVRHRILLVTSRRKELLLDSGAHDEPCVSLPRLVAVSKKHEAKRLLGAYESGQRVFGENFVQVWALHCRN